MLESMGPTRFTPRRDPTQVLRTDTREVYHQVTDATWRPGDPLAGFVAPPGMDTQRQSARAVLLGAVDDRHSPLATTERDYLPIVGRRE